MSRTTDVAIGVGLLVVGSLPLAVVLAAIVWFRSPVVGTPAWVAAGTLGGIWAVLVCPAGYKLVRYPSTRTVSLGELVAELRRDQFGLAGGGMLVCFSGIDGSGKTTQAERLVEEFDALDVPAVHVWARWRPFVSYPVMGVLYVLLGWRRKDYHQSRVLRAVWAYLVLVDQVLFFVRHLLPPLVRGKVVFVDRYRLDQLVELEYDGLYNARAAALLRRVLPAAERTFLLDVPVETALERKDDTQEMLDRLHIAEDAETYLRRRRELYLKHVERFDDATVVDTTRPIEETHREAKESTFEAYFGM